MTTPISTLPASVLYNSPIALKDFYKLNADKLGLPANLLY